MLAAAQCQLLAQEYKSLASRHATCTDHSAMLINIARSLPALATQLDRLEAHMRTP
jgi:hypothetical protein